MRSRNGNSNFSLSICSIILFNSLALNAGEYLISYRYSVKNAILYNETLDISKAMKKCTGNAYDSITLKTNKSKNLKTVIDFNSEEFIEYIHKLGLNLTHKEKTINLHNSFTTILTLKTKCFEVSFNDNFVKISPLK